MEKEDTMFIKIQDPTAVRRSLLESSKEVLTSLQHFERYNYLREAKIKNVFILKSMMLELNKLCSDLEYALPIQHLIKKKQKESRKAGTSSKHSRRKQKHIIPRVKPRSELQKLEEELSEIEGKLEGLQR